MVAEPSVADTINILRGLSERYSSFHGVRIADRALVIAAELSDRYITDRFLPDKVRWPNNFVLEPLEQIIYVILVTLYYGSHNHNHQQENDTCDVSSACLSE